MPLELGDTTATLTGAVTVDEVERLAGWLRTTAKPRINLRRCSHLHTGAFQLLLRVRPRIAAVPTDPFLAGQLLPMLTDSGEAGSPQRPGSRGRG